MAFERLKSRWLVNLDIEAREADLKCEDVIHGRFGARTRVSKRTTSLTWEANKLYINKQGPGETYVND